MESLTEEAQWALQTRQQLHRWVETSHIRRLPLPQRRAELRGFLQQQLRNTPAKEHSRRLKALMGYFPHWHFAAPAAEPSLKELSRQLVAKAQELGDTEKRELREDLQAQKAIPPPETAVTPPGEFCQALGLSPDVKLDPAKICALLLFLLEALSKNRETATAIYNVIKPGPDPDMEMEDLVRLTAAFLAGPPAQDDENLQRLKELNGAKTTRDLLRAMDAAPQMFCDEHFPYIGPNLIRTALRKDLRRDPTEKECWDLYNKHARKWTQQEIKESFRDALYKGYLKWKGYAQP